MHFRLRDINPAVVAAWRECFANVRDVTVSEGDIFAEPADAVVSPANSFGFMDGGIDLAYSMRFGWDLQARLQSRLREAHDGELPVGQAVAFRAVIRSVRDHNRVAPQPPIRSILCPGLGTAVGRMAPVSCAKQMYAAYRTAHLGETFTPSDLMEACRNHWDLAGPQARRAV